jgi:hypothetical protein
MNQVVTTTVSGTTYSIGGWAHKAAVTLTGTAYGGTTHSFTVLVEHSFDGGASWLTLVTMTAMTANGFETKFATEDAGTIVLGNSMRARVSASSGTTPTANLKVVLTIKD